MSTSLSDLDSFVRSRPSIPGYGVPETDEGMLELADVRERLEQARNYWICTVSTAGEPHAVPVWGGFLEDALYVGAGPRSKRNLQGNPRVSVHLESGDQVVILEGRTEQVDDPSPELSRALDDHFANKYEWRPSEDSDEAVGKGMYALRPERIIAWTSFPVDATRWTRRP